MTYLNGSLDHLPHNSHQASFSFNELIKTRLDLVSLKQTFLLAGLPFIYPFSTTSSAADQSTMKDPGTARSRSSLLVEIPAEVQGIISDKVSGFDVLPVDSKIYRLL